MIHVDNPGRLAVLWKISLPVQNSLLSQKHMNMKVLLSYLRSHVFQMKAHFSDILHLRWSIFFVSFSGIHLTLLPSLRVTGHWWSGGGYLWALFLLLARYVPNVPKSSIWDQCKKKYILRTDWPTTDLTFGKISNGHISVRGIRSTSCLVLWWGFRGRWIEWCNFRYEQKNKSIMVAWPPSWKIPMAISPWRMIWFTPCLGGVFGVGGSNGAISGLTKFNRYVGKKQCTRSD